MEYVWKLGFGHVGENITRFIATAREKCNIIPQSQVNSVLFAVYTILMTPAVGHWYDRHTILFILRHSPGMSSSG